jgi:epoxyqueuosine reductase
MIGTMGLALAVKQRAIESGFDLAGIAPLGAWQDLEFSRHWVERGYGGEMRYLANPQRDDPRRLLPSARSVVCVGLVYNAPLPYSTEVVKTPLNPGPSPQGRGWPDSGGPGEGSSRGWISRYAWGRDYHEAMRARLERLRKAIEELAPGVETRVYVDTGPIVERAFARLSGIGWMGKNTCLINEPQGSWFFLGVVLTSLELEPDLPAPDRCGSCTACLEACPTGALVEPYVMDASRCISYFTIELRGSIPVAFRAQLGANIFGCDICQDVCPWNSGQWSVVTGQSKGPALGRQPGVSHEPSTGTAPHGRRPAITDDPAFQPMTVELPGSWARDPDTPKQPTPHNGQRTTDNPQPTDKPVSSFQFPVSLFNPPLEALASLTEHDFRRLFAHSPIKRAKYRGWLRNLSVAMGNSGDREFVPWLERLAQQDDPVLREHAEWALNRLKQPSGQV